MPPARAAALLAAAAAARAAAPDKCDAPATMKAVVHTAYGDPRQALELRDAHPVPALDADSADLLVKVHAAAINPIDYKLVKGDMELVMKLALPRVPGFDVSGVVVQAGAKCTRFKAGDRIYADSASKQGSLAEYMLVPEAHATTPPAGLSHEQAASIPLAGLTAYQGWKKGGLQKGGKVLVLGGSGGTGTFALQIAKALGAGHVATTSSSEELCRRCGADQVINYKKGERFGDVLAGQDYDIVFDCVGGYDGWEQSRRVLKPAGAFVTIVGDSAEKMTVLGLARNVGKIAYRMAAAAVGLGPSYTLFLTDATDVAALEHMNTMVEGGELAPIVDPSSPYTLEQAHAAFDMQMSGRAKGKLVFKVAAGD